MWGSETECGLSVLARAAARPAVGHLHPALLPALAPGDAVLVSGDAGSGCSMLLYDLVARALLPLRWGGVDLSGCGAHVLFLDTDLHFCVLQLSVVAEGRVRRAVRAARRQMKAAAEAGVGTGSASSATCASGATVTAETKIHLAVGHESDVKNQNSLEIQKSVVGMNSNDCKKSSSSESASYAVKNSETVCKKNKYESEKVGADVANELETVISAKVPGEQTSALHPSTASGLHPPLPSPSTDFSSLQWLCKTPRAKLKRLVKELVASCLVNFLYLRCSYSTQFMTTLLSLDTLLAAHPRVSLVCVDSLSNFYWHDRAFVYETWKSTEQYYNKIMKSVLDGVSKNRVVLVGVQQPLFAKQKCKDQNSDSTQERVYEHYNFLGPSLASDARFKIQVRRVRTTGRHEFVVSERDGAVRTLSAVYRAEGINWI